MLIFIKLKLINLISKSFIDAHVPQPQAKYPVNPLDTVSLLHSSHPSDFSQPLFSWYASPEKHKNKPLLK
jgi:hypothetical protein